MDQQSPQTAKTPSSSIRPLPKQHHRNRRKHNLQIKQQRLILDVVEIQKNHFLESDMTSAGNLPESCDPGLEFFPVLDRLPEFRFLFHFLKILHRQRSGSNETHVTLEYVQKLRELVDTITANESTNLRPTGIILHLEEGAVSFVVVIEAILQFIGVLDHATEFVKIENLSAFYGTPLLLEEDRTTRFPVYCQRRYDKYR